MVAVSNKHIHFALYENLRIISLHVQNTAPSSVKSVKNNLVHNNSKLCHKTEIGFEWKDVGRIVSIQ